MTTEKPENYNNSRQHRDFGRHNIYMPKNINNIYYANRSNYYKDENRFRFKNSLIITPNYEIEFNGTGGVKYIKNNDDCIFFTGGNIFFRTNNIQKMPVLLKREINKLSSQKKLIVEEKYNYEEKYEVHQNIILYYEENRIDFQVIINKFKSQDLSNPDEFTNNHSKDITTEISLNLDVPGLNDAVTYKKFAENEEYKNFISKLSHTNSLEYSDSQEFDKDSPILEAIEYIILKCGKSEDLYMTVYPEKRQILKCKNKSLGFAVPNYNHDKNYINLRVYLEKYKVI